MPQMQVGQGVRRARLTRVVNLRCGCAIEFPEIDSRDWRILRFLKGLIQRPRYLARCSDVGNVLRHPEWHRSLAELTRRPEGR